VIAGSSQEGGTCQVSSCGPGPAATSEVNSEIGQIAQSIRFRPICLACDELIETDGG